jgi:DNA-binding winged helix-turn-helix (wHTH) protein
VKVSLVRWPTERDRREALRQAGEPRLLLVEQGAPPVPSDHREDWIRLPADDVDLRVRVEALRRRLGGEALGMPGIDEDGVLRVGDRWVALPPVEARLAAVLVERFGAVVSRDTLTKAGWPGGSSSRNALDVHVLRLRRRLAPLQLAIRTVRSRGYLLERADGAGQVVTRPERPRSVRTHDSHAGRPRAATDGHNGQRAAR